MAMTDHGAMLDVGPGRAWDGSLLVRSVAVVWLAAAALVPGEAESEETIMLIADPRAQRGYELQGEGDETEDQKDLASEKLQCLRCEYPLYLPEPDETGPGLSQRATERGHVVAWRSRSWVSLDSGTCCLPRLTKRGWQGTRFCHGP